MSDDLITRAKASLEGITEAPWQVHEEKVPGYSPHYGVSGGPHVGLYANVAYAQVSFDGFGNGSRQADAEFIAAARTLVPELVAEVEFLRSRLLEAEKPGVTIVRDADITYPGTNYFVNERQPKTFDDIHQLNREDDAARGNVPWGDQ